MSVTSEIRKTVDEARAALSDPKPLHVVAGVGDLVVERFRTAAAAQRKAVGAVRQESAELPARVTATVGSVRRSIGSLPEQAQDVVIGTANRANETYDGLAQRGASLVRRVRRQRATQDLEEQVGSTVRAAKATRTTATKAAGSTTTRVKATTTSARKAADAAVDATAGAASKTGTTRTTRASAKPAARSAPKRATKSATKSAAKPAAKRTTAKRPVRSTAAAAKS